MSIRYSRILSILVIAVIPFLIAGLFVYRNEFPDVEPIFGAPVHLAGDVFFASSTIPAIGSVVMALIIQIPLFIITQANPSTRITKLVITLTGIALIPILWAAIVSTEIWVRSLYFGLWDMYVLGFSPMSTSSYVIGIIISILILIFSIRPMHKMEAA